MTRDLKCAGIVAIAVLVGIALTSPAPVMAQASSFTEVATSPFGPVIVVSSCTAETITIQGTQRSLIHATFDAGGGGHFRFHTGQKGTGTGSLGNTYTFVSTGSSEADFSGSGAQSFTVQMHSRLITAGPNNNQMLHSVVHVTFNSNGTMTATVDTFTADCQ